MRTIDHFLKAIRAAFVFNPEIQIAPACILWLERNHQWEAALPVLQPGLSNLMVLGNNQTEMFTRSAIWSCSGKERSVCSASENDQYWASFKNGA
jgi:hypothetical protein